MILDNSIVEQVIGLVDGAEHKRGVLISVCFDYGARHFARQLDRAASVAGNIAHAERAQPDLWHKLAESIGVQPGCMMPGRGTALHLRGVPQRSSQSGWVAPTPGLQRASSPTCRLTLRALLRRSWTQL